MKFGPTGIWIGDFQLVTYYGIILMAGAVAGLGVGATLPYRQILSLKQDLPPLQRRLAMIAMISFAVFAAISGFGMLTSNLSLKGQ